jgi:hypothetical protein
VCAWAIMTFLVYPLALLVALQASLLVYGFPLAADGMAAERDAAADLILPARRQATAATVAGGAERLATRTSVYPISTSTTVLAPFAMPYTFFEYTTTGMATRLEPVPTSFPTAVRVEIVSDVTIQETASMAAAPPAMSTYTAQLRDVQTWHLYQPQPTDLPATTNLESTCGSCRSQDYKPDAKCEAMGLETACQAQCQQRDGTWWCRSISQPLYNRGPDVRMGRACWGNETHYLQLNSPCRVGDPLIECVSCRGNLHNFVPKNWH